MKLFDGRKLKQSDQDCHQLPRKDPSLVILNDSYHWRRVRQDLQRPVLHGIQDHIARCKPVDREQRHNCFLLLLCSLDALCVGFLPIVPTRELLHAQTAGIAAWKHFFETRHAVVMTARLYSDQVCAVIVEADGATVTSRRGARVLDDILHDLVIKLGVQSVRANFLYHCCEGGNEEQSNGRAGDHRSQDGEPAPCLD